MRSTVLALLLAMVGAAAGAPLTEGESLRLGLARHELAEIERAALDEAEADAQEAGQWPNPSLEYSRDATNDRGGAPGGTEHNWIIAQSFDVSGRRSLRRSAGARRVDAARAGNAARREERASEIRRSFHETLLRQQTLRATTEWMRQFDHIENIVMRLEKAGEVSGYDRRRLARERQTGQARLAAERGEVARAQARLAALLGNEVAACAELSGTLLPAPAPALTGALERLAGRPEFEALARKSEAAELEQRAATRGWVPEVSIGLGGKRVDDGISRAGGSLLSVSLPLPLFDRGGTARQRAAAQAIGARAEHAMAWAKAQGEVRGLHHQLEHLLEAAAGYRRHAVTASAELLRIAEAAYQAGEFTILELLDAYKGALEAETTALELEWKARSARIEFDFLVGSHQQ